MNKFDQTYNNIINESFGQGLKNIGNSIKRGLTFGLAGKKGNERLSDRLKAALEKYKFDLQGGDGQESFSEASKIVRRIIKKVDQSGQNFTVADLKAIGFLDMDALDELKVNDNQIVKYYKIVVFNEYDKETNQISYSVKCFNAVSGKKVKISANNFKLKSTWDQDEIIQKGLNPCIAPLEITEEGDLSEQLQKLKGAKAKKADQKKAADEDAANKKKQADEDAANKKKQVEQKRAKLQTGMQTFKKFINQKKSKFKDGSEQKKKLIELNNKCNEMQDSLEDNKMDEAIQNYKDAKAIYRQLEMK